MRLVILESPYAGDIEANIAYARRAVYHSLSLGEAPIASHLLYTQHGILNDSIEAERKWGIDAGLAWKRVADAVVYYMDRGFSSGMRYGIKECLKHDVLVYARWIDNPVDMALLGSLEIFFTGIHSYASC